MVLFIAGATIRFSSSGGNRIIMASLGFICYTLLALEMKNMVRQYCR